VNSPSTEANGTSPRALILLEFLGEGVARITLNRPEQRNAMNRDARAALIDSLDACRNADPAVRVIVLTGSGSAFCAGIDLKEAAGKEREPDTAEERRISWRAVQEEIARHPAIVVAAVNGFALGGGTTLINVADLALAAEDAQIGMPEIGFGMYPALAGPSTQLRLNRKHAAWLVLTAERIDGRTAQRWGLVNQAVPAEQLAGAALALAHKVASYDAVALQWAKKALWEIPAQTSDWSRALEYGEEVNGQIRARTAASRDGLNAFAAGRRNPGQGSQG
jgi:enoyl-CoA hydratase/carnithine racemase